MNKEEYKIIKVKIPTLSDLEIKRNINDSLYSIEEINKLVIKDKQEQYIRELLNRINKAITLIEDDYYSSNTLKIENIGYTSNKLLRVREILKGGKQ